MVGTTMMDRGVCDLVESIEFEDTDGMADQLKIIIKNPDYVISDNRIFMVGSEVSVFMGYGGDHKHVGRARIYKVAPIFEQDVMPSIEITGWTRDHEMMHNSPPQATSRGRSGGKRIGGKRVQSQDGRIFKNVKYSEAVEQRAKSYNFKTDVDVSPDSPSDFVQAVGMSDYDFIQGMANITGYVFWVDGTPKGEWTLHFKDPEKLKEQDMTFKFEYNMNNASTLFRFEPEFLVSESVAQIRARTLNTDKGEVVEVEFSEDSVAGTPELEITNPYDVASEIIRGSPEQALSVQLYIGDYTFYEVANRRFKSEAELRVWAKQWFRRNKENFITARADTIGVANIRSRQVHEIAGVGKVYSGKYYFSRVAHRCSNDASGYMLDFSCRKQTPKD